jgi:type IV pilus assembly protein PilB
VESKGLKVYHGRGCQECNSTGYSGRTGIFEVMPITPNIERMILAGATNQELQAQAIKDGMLTLRQAALKKLKDGVTTVEEVLAETAG